MVERSVEEAPGQGLAKPLTCTVCGKEFRELRGLKGHMAGVHGVKQGLNATMQGFTNELKEVRESLARLEKAMVILLRNYYEL
jgi:hypothetical protein